MRRLELDHRANVLENHVAPRALRQPEAHFLADDLVGLRGEPGDLGIGDRDDFHRDALIIEEALRFIVTRGGPGRLSAAVRGDVVRDRCRGMIAFASQIREPQLQAVGIDEAPLALLAEELALEPVELPLEGFVLDVELPIHLYQNRDLLGGGRVGLGTGIPTAILTEPQHPCGFRPYEGLRIRAQNCRLISKLALSHDNLLHV